MARPATGQVVVRETREGRVFALRFRAHGRREYLTLGLAGAVWSTGSRPDTRLSEEGRAQRELEAVLREVDLGRWKPPARDTAPATSDPAFHEFASDWFAGKRGEIRSNTTSSYRNDLTNHLLPFFGKHRLSQITVAEVDRYRQAKVRESDALAAAIAAGKPRIVEVVDRHGRAYRRPQRPLSARSINMHLTLLAQVLDVAVDRELLERNPAKGRRRRLKAGRPRPVYLDTAEHLAVLLEAAGAIDNAEGCVSTSTGRRAAIAVMMLAGLRAEEVGQLLWRDVDLANGRISVGRAKTAAGVREVDLLAVLRDELLEHKAAARGRPPMIRCSSPRAAATRSRATATTCGSVSSRRRYVGPTSCSLSAAASRCRWGSRPTSCVTRSPRCWWRSAKTQAT